MKIKRSITGAASGVFAFGILLMGAWSPAKAQLLTPPKGTAIGCGGGTSYVPCPTNNAFTKAPVDGCVGAPLATCVARIRAVFTMRSDDIDGTIQQNKRVDVNGNPMVHDPKLMLFGKFKATPNLGYQGIIVSYGPDQVVHKIAVNLARDPSLAHTQDDYDHTGMTNAVFLAVGHTCKEAQDPLTIYRFFDNEIKPNIQANGRDLDADMNGAHDLYRSSSAPVSFCGASVSYSSVVGNTTDSMSDDNPNGLMSAANLVFTD